MQDWNSGKTLTCLCSGLQAKISVSCDEINNFSQISPTVSVIAYDSFAILAIFAQ